MVVQGLGFCFFVLDCTRRRRGEGEEGKGKKERGSRTSRTKGK
jgi:hypothetical protein